MKHQTSRKCVTELVARLKKKAGWADEPVSLLLRRLQSNMAATQIFSSAAMTQIGNLIKRVARQEAGEALGRRGAKASYLKLLSTAFCDMRMLPGQFAQWTKECPADHAVLAIRLPSVILQLVWLPRAVGLSEASPELFAAAGSMEFANHLLRICGQIEGAADCRDAIANMFSEQMMGKSATATATRMHEGNVLANLDWLLPFVGRAEQLKGSGQASERECWQLACDFLQFLGWSRTFSGVRLRGAVLDALALPKGKSAVGVEIKTPSAMERGEIRVLEQGRHVADKCGLRYMLITDGDRFLLMDARTRGHISQSVLVKFQLTNLKPVDLRALGLFKFIISDRQDFGARILALPSCFSRATRAASA